MKYEIAIIGGGPVGMYAAFFAGMRKANAVLIESLESLGGQITALYPKKTLLDIPAFANVTGENLIVELEKQMQLFPIDVKLEQTVDNLTKQADGYYLIETNKETIYAKTIIIATGRGNFDPKKLDITLADEVLNNVHYQVTDYQQFVDKEVLIAGGGDSAVDIANEISQHAKQTMLTHRRETFRALESSVDKLKKNKINLFVPYLIENVLKYNDQLKVSLKNIETDETKEVIVDDLIVSYGFVSDNETIENWCDKPKFDAGFFNTKDDIYTDKDDIFVIGDAGMYPGKTDLIAIGFGEAPRAVNACLTKIAPEKLTAVHSTALKV